jgi:hypothetical protein
MVLFNFLKSPLIMLDVHGVKANVLPLASLSVKSEICMLDFSISKSAGLSTTTSNRALQVVVPRNDGEVSQRNIP